MVAAAATFAATLRAKLVSEIAGITPLREPGAPLFQRAQATGRAPAPKTDCLSGERRGGGGFGGPGGGFGGRDFEPLVGHVELPEPLLRVEASSGDGPWGPARYRGRPVDDQGWAVEITYLRQDGDRHHYRVRWHDPAFAGDRRHRFVLEPNRGQPELASEPFD